MTVTQELNTTSALELWRKALVERVRGNGPDLTARQMALLLTVYLTPGPHTVRDLAKMLSISKPAVTRALDKLSFLDFIKRKVDENDRRSIFIQRTVNGSVYLSDFAEMVKRAAGSGASLDSMAA